jgi:sodium-dependent dicarboxylate transporter 2/3/5
MRKHLIEKTKWKMVLLSLAIGLISWFTPLGLPIRMQSVLAIMFFVGALWFTEAIPLHVTALLIPLLLTLFAAFTPRETLAPFFDPVVVLLLGGFILAVAMQKHRLDEKIAYFFINHFGHTPGRFLLGLMVVTAFLSMWMTNTATTALIIPIALVILVENKLEPLRSGYAKAVVLGIAYAATIGGMGTLVGSTPNAIAAKFLRDMGITLSFTDWMLYALPLVIILIPIAWFVLMSVYPSNKKSLKVKWKMIHMHINNK